MSSAIDITPELMAGFLDEAPEYLEMLDTGLMELESKAGSGVLSLEDPDDREQMNTMFRAAHSLKGLAAAFGFDKIKDLTHLMETLFDQVRMMKRDLAADSFEILFTVFDRLKALVKELSDDSMAPVEIEDVLDGLNRILESSSSPASTGATSGGEVAATQPPAAESDPGTEAHANDPPSQPPAPVQAGTVDEAARSEVFGDPELATLFVETTSEALDEMNEALVRLEESPDDRELLNTIFRCAHNIKGASGAAGLPGLNQLTHNMETVFEQLRNDRLSLDDELTTALLTSADQIRQLVDRIREGRIDDIPPETHRDRFAQWSMGGGPAHPTADQVEESGAVTEEAPSTMDTDAPAERKIAGAGDGSSSSAPPVDLGDGQLCVTVHFPDGFDEAAIQAYLICNKLSELGTVLSTEPNLDSLQGDTPVSIITFIVECDVDPADLHRILMSYGAERVTINGVEGPVGVAASGRTQADTQTSNSAEVDMSEAASPADAVSATSTAGSTSAAATTTPSGTAPSTGAAPPSDSATKPTTATPKKPAAPPKGKAKTAAGGNPEQNIPKTGETLRVDQERLDDLMNLGGELVINRARFAEVHSRFREVFDGKNLSYVVDDITDRLSRLGEHVESLRATSRQDRNIEELSSNLLHLGQSFSSVRALVQKVHEARTSMLDFDEALHALSRVSESIQKGIMSTRMIPIGPLFNRFRRVVRDISKSTGKQVELVLRGEQTELDKRMIDELGDPLTHMVRNSVDHGIETPAERIAAGKDPKGTIVLEACHRGNNICIEVTDDGAGINIERVKAKVIENELATPAQVEKMTDRELIQYVLKPGFSTAEVVTDLSGRGMGMDIVVNKLEKLNGTIDIDSTRGESTRVVIKLPLTIAILTSMVARIGRGVYAIPLETVAEIITVRRADIQRIQRREVARVRDRVVPIARFEEIFDTNRAELRTETRDSDELTLMIIGFDDEQIGLVVDELYGQDDVVIKSLADNYRNVRGIAGASIRGDGTVSLILDVGAMMEMAAKAAADASPAPVPAMEG